jgi:hypothetical protein
VVIVNSAIPKQGIYTILGRVSTLVYDGALIKVDLAAVNTSQSFNPTLLLAVVITHEIGHKLGRPHPLRPGCCSEVPAPSPLVHLSNAQFAFTTPTDRSRVFVRLATHATAGQIDSVAVDQKGLVIKGVYRQGGTQDANGTDVYRVHVDPPVVSSVPPVSVLVEIHTGYLMDWSSFPFITNWRFAPLDVDVLCMTEPCRS